MSLWSLGTHAILPAANGLRTHTLQDVRTPAPPAAGRALNSALSALAKYIPAETTTLYMAALSLLLAPANKGANQSAGSWALYIGCAVLTPLLVLLAARASWLALQATLPFQVPWWRMAAATVAFAIWGLAVPGFPVDESWVLPLGLGAIFASPLLVLLEQQMRLDQ